MPRLLSLVALALAIVSAAAGCSGRPRDAVAGTDAATPIELLNVSYDPTRELYRDINQVFARHYAEVHGRAVDIKQSHAASGSQARAVIDGLGQGATEAGVDLGEAEDIADTGPQPVEAEPATA